MMSVRRFRDATNAPALGRGLLVLLLLGYAASANESAPVAVINELHAGLLAAAEHKQQPWVERYASLQPLIVASHDLDYIGRFTLRRQWADFTEAEQTQFRLAFEKLAVASYVARFGGLAEANFEIVNEAALPRDRYQVMTILRPAAAEPVTLDYVLHMDAQGGWRIINVVANEVSDLALKRAEYQRLYSAGGLPELLKELAAQADRLAESPQD